MLDIRVLGLDDAKDYWKLRLEALDGEPLAFGSSVEETRADGFEATTTRHLRDEPQGGFILGAFLDGPLVGIVGLGRSERIKQRHLAGAVSMYVTPSARGRGVGRALMNALIQRARGYEGLDRVGLSVTSRATAARTLYASLGFVTYGVEPQALKVGDAYADFEHMSLALR